MTVVDKCCVCHKGMCWNVELITKNCERKKLTTNQSLLKNIAQALSSVQAKVYRQKKKFIANLFVVEKW